MYSSIENLGFETEMFAYEELTQRYKEVIWVSLENNLSPYDFVCTDASGKKFYVDCKHCSQKLIHISNNKIKRLKAGEWSPFYYFIKYKQNFYLLSFKNIFNKKTLFEFVEKNINYYNDKMIEATSQRILSYLSSQSKELYRNLIAKLGEERIILNQLLMNLCLEKLVKDKRIKMRKINFGKKILQLYRLTSHKKDKLESERWNDGSS